MITWRYLMLAWISCGLAAAGAQAVDAPAKKEASDKPPISVINNAIADLQREYQAWKKDPGANKLRDKANFFVEYSSEKVTPELVVRGLETSVSGDGAGEAYVKWQLLSGMPAKVPDELVKRVVAAYRKAPRPIAHPGLEHKALTKMIAKVKKEDVAGINKEFGEAVGKVAAGNRLIVAYRNELFSRLPAEYDVLSIGLDDVLDRGSCGLNANAIFDNVSTGVRNWSIGSPKASELKSVVSQVTQLAHLANSEDARPYTRLDDKKTIRWVTDQVIAPKKPEELLRFLENTGGGGLKFKDAKP